MIAPTVLVVGARTLRLPAETADTESPPVKLDATLVAAPRAVTVARVSLSVYSGGVVAFHAVNTGSLSDVNQLIGCQVLSPRQY
jgi:hypothetical protein